MVTTQLAFETGTDAFNARNLDRFAQLLADDVVFQAPGCPRTAGKQACVDFYSGLFDAFPDAQFESRRLYILDEVAIEEGTFTGTGRTDRAVELDYVQVMSIENGEYVSMKLLLDRLTMLEQLDLAPGKDCAGPQAL
ncbi:MAG TPA: nuclear transport factor 2 family protein [Solirubrobacteraceae bacterium]|nr:nuclear transport factor 2 family protein [Solirubrobacteraceae bacterium]